MEKQANFLPYCTTCVFDMTDGSIVWHITRTLKDPSDMDCSSN